MEKRFIAKDYFLIPFWDTISRSDVSAYGSNLEISKSPLIIAFFSVPKAPKRQPWDLKGRLEDMENMFRATQERVGALEKEKTELSTEVEIKQTVVQQSSVELDTIRSGY